MKLALLIGLLFVAGCASTPTPLPELHNRVLKADNDWKEFNQWRTPKMYHMLEVARERMIYEKVRKTDIPDWRIRRAGWNYVVAVNEARVPDVPVPPGRGSVHPSPFQ